MTLRRQLALPLLIGGLLAMLVIVAWRPHDARPAAAPTPGQLAIYARGWIDGAAPPGIYVTRATCDAKHVCTVRLNDGSCARATINSYQFPGPWHHCRKVPPA